MYGTDYTWYNLTTIDTFIAKGMNAFAISTAELPSGTYVVTAVGGAWKTAAKLVVQH